MITKIFKDESGVVVFKGRKLTPEQKTQIRQRIETQIKRLGSDLSKLKRVAKRNKQTVREYLIAKNINLIVIAIIEGLIKEKKWWHENTIKEFVDVLLENLQEKGESKS